MMDEIPFRTKKDQLVRLKGEATSLYPFAHSGAPGWVRGHRKDELGWPQVRIEWDKDWWGYNGEQDRWAIEDHFDVVEKPKDDQVSDNKSIPPEVMAAMAALGQWASTQQSDEPAPQIEPKVETQRTAAEMKVVNQQHYAAVLEDAVGFAREADAVLVLAVKCHETTGGTEMIPKLFTSYKDGQAGVLLEMQIPKIAAQSHAELGVMALQMLADNKKERSE
jgi:hypothetical protein